MVQVFRIMIVIAALWALYLPGAYGILFAFVMHWSAAVDFMIVLCCLILTVSAFTKVTGAVLSMCLIILAVSSISGLFFHFKDSGESGPLPFEWLNDYLVHVLPLLILYVLFKIVRRRSIAQPARTSDAGQHL